MLTYLHDIRNKLTLISGQTALLSKKYGEEDFIPIRTNLVRISEIINDAYRHLKDEMNEARTKFSPQELIRQLDVLTEAAQLLFPIEIKNEIRDYKPGKSYNVEFNIGLVFQVIENALDNSIKANSSKIIVRLLESGNNCIFEIVDNGTGKIQKESIEEASIIPHGIGKEIMIQNMQKVDGKIEWARRLDQNGMIVRMYFPKKA